MNSLTTPNWMWRSQDSLNILHFIQVGMINIQLMFFL